jgi:lysophospholipase L1-like esterase
MVVETRGAIGERWGRLGRATRVPGRAFAGYWRAHNEEALRGSGPLWVALGDSTAQGLGAPTPLGGYVGQVHAELVRHTGEPWRVVNLSRSGAVAAQVVRRQIPLIDQLPTAPDLVTCGVGSNDILHTSPRRVHPALSALIGRLPRSEHYLGDPVAEFAVVVQPREGCAAIAVRRDRLDR